MEPVELTPEDLLQAEKTRLELQKLMEQDPSMLESVGSGIVEGAKEAPFQAARGVQEGMNEVSDTSFSIAKWLNDNVIDLGHLKFGGDAKGGAGPEGFVQWFPGMPEQNNLKFGEDTLVGEAPKTVIGNLTNDIAQFVGGYATLGRLFKTTSVAGGVAHGMVKGAIVDAAAFDPHEERLANLIEQHTDFAKPVTDFLAARPDDTEAEGRFKNALEGLVLGGMTDAVFHAVRAVRFKQMGKMDEAAAALDEVEKAEAAAKAKPTEESAATAPKEEAKPEEPKKEEEQLNLDLGDTPQDTFTGTRGENGKLKPEDLAPDVPPKTGPFKDIKPVVKLSEEDLQHLDNMRTAELGFGQGRNLSGIRTDLWEVDEDINQNVSAIARQYGDRMRRMMGGNADGVRSWDRTRANAEKFADLIGEDPRILFQRMRAMHKENFMADAEMLAYRDVMATANARLEEAAEAIANSNYNYATGKFKSVAEAREAFAKHWEILANTQLMYKGLQTSFARTMNSFKIAAKARNGLLEGADPDAMWKGGPEAMQKMARQVLANRGNLAANAKAARRGFVQKFFDVVQEFQINSLLSGPKTHLVNMVSGVFNSAFLPAEKMLYGAAKLDLATAREAAEQYWGMVMSAREAAQLAAKAFKAGDPVLDPTHGGAEHRAAISAANFNITDPVASAVVNGLGNLVRIPSRFLAAEDEFLKQINYRAAIRAQAWREARAEGKEGKAFSEHVATRLNEAISPTGSAFNAKGEALNERALRQAREATYTQDLGAESGTWFGNQTLGQSIQNFAAAHPYLRTIVPFIRTPTNLFRFVHNRTPVLNLLRKQYAYDFMGKNGQEAADRARAQFLSGGLLWAGAISYVHSGDVTGAGPTDPDIRKALMDTGWRPYSIRVEKEDGTVQYVQYNRFDPFGMFLGLAADFAEVSGAYPERDLDETALAMTTALAKNLNNKSYLTGIINGLGAMAEPERRGEFFLQGLASGFVPNFMQQSLNDDPYFREARSVIEAMRRKVPGYSDDLDPRRNVLGEKQYIPPALGPDWLSPVVTGYNKNDTQPITEEWKRTPKEDVYDELSRVTFLNNSPIRQPARMQYGVDLTQYRSPDTGYTAYDRYQELVGVVKDNDGLTLKERLGELFKSDEYKNVLGDGDIGVDGGRIEAIRNVVGAFRQMALDQLRQEIPQLHYDLIEGQRKEFLSKVQEQYRPTE